MASSLARQKPSFELLPPGVYDAVDGRDDVDGVAESVPELGDVEGNLEQVDSVKRSR